MTAQVHGAKILQRHVFDQGVVSSQEPGRVWGDQQVRLARYELVAEKIIEKLE